MSRPLDERVEGEWTRKDIYMRLRRKKLRVSQPTQLITSYTHSTTLNGSPKQKVQIQPYIDFSMCAFTWTHNNMTKVATLRSRELKRAYELRPLLKTCRPSYHWWFDSKQAMQTFLPTQSRRRSWLPMLSSIEYFPLALSEKKSRASANPRRSLSWCNAYIAGSFGNPILH